MLFIGSIASCAIGAFFVGAYFSSSTSASVATPSPVTLSDLEKKFADNPDNVFTILAETRALLAGSTKNQVVLKRSRLQLERATAALYQKHLDTIALNLYRKGDAVKFREAFEEHTKTEIKADVTAAYAARLKQAVLGGNINPKNREFRAYAYLLGRLADEPTKSGTGTSLNKTTIDALNAAEKGNLKSRDLLLDNTDMERVFQSLGYLPWRTLDLKTMRRTITSESLSAETRYTRAYITAQMIFGRNALGNRIYLRNTLKHQKQIASLSCEANSTAHFYNFYAGLSKLPLMTEKQTFETFPVDNRLPELVSTATGNQRTWGDPDRVFVGQVEGRQSSNQNKLTGYGIHAKGVEPVLKQSLAPLGYVPELKTFNEMNIVLSLANDHPVLFWYVFSEDPKKGFAKLEWKTWDGEARTGYIGEHTGIIVGVELTKAGELSKVGYYEGLSETIIWEDWNTLKSKAKYFDTIIVAEKKSKQ